MKKRVKPLQMVNSGALLLVVAALLALLWNRTLDDALLLSDRRGPASVSTP